MHVPVHVVCVAYVVQLTGKLELSDELALEELSAKLELLDELSSSIKELTDVEISHNVAEHASAHQLHDMANEHVFWSKVSHAEQLSSDDMHAYPHHVH